MYNSFKNYHSIIWEQKQENKIDEYVPAVSMKIDQTHGKKFNKKTFICASTMHNQVHLIDLWIIQASGRP